MLNKYKEKLRINNEVYLRIKVRPNSSKTEIREIMEDETVKVDVAAIPEKGKANKELIKYLAREFKVNKENVKILSGISNRIKLVKITNGEER
ncbi:YggU family protein [Candidatus Parcubacteria bacterium]|nr:YggU family protein [Candidatus Parcubacteria bacterium]